MSDDVAYLRTLKHIFADNHVPRGKRIPDQWAAIGFNRIVSSHTVGTPATQKESIKMEEDPQITIDTAPPRSFANSLRPDRAPGKLNFFKYSFAQGETLATHPGHAEADEEVGEGETAEGGKRKWHAEELLTSWVQNRGTPLRNFPGDGKITSVHVYTYNTPCNKKCSRRVCN